MPIWDLFFLCPIQTYNPYYAKREKGSHIATLRTLPNNENAILVDLDAMYKSESNVPPMTTLDLDAEKLKHIVNE